MKKRILSLVLCAVMLLSMCLFMGAGVVDDTADTADTTDAAGMNIVSVLNAGPLVGQTQSAVTPRLMAASRSAISLAAANDTTGSDTKNDAVVLNKEVTDNGDGTYTVRLEAYATGEEITTVSTQPCDIVLVLDVSGSMDWCIEGGENCNHTHYTPVYEESIKYGQTSPKYYMKDEATGEYKELDNCDGKHGNNSSCAGGAGLYPETSSNGSLHTKEAKITPKTSADDTSGVQIYILKRTSCTSRLTALKSAVNTFIDQVAAKETEDVQHRISIVKFAGTNNDAVGNDKYKDNRYTGGPFNYSQTVKGLTDAKSGKAELKNAVNALTPAGATRADYGMQHAQTVLNSARDGASKVVVMFTDGSPTSESSFEKAVANKTIENAKTLKDSGVTVYTVGCMDGADASRVTDISKLGDTNVNKYMHLVSSNYKNATSMSSPGTATYPEDTNQSYYLTAKTAEELEKVFKSISSQTGGAATELTSSAVLKDAVTPYFEIPAGATVTLKTADCTGANSDGTLVFGTETEITDGSVTATVGSDNTVSVTGFDYKDNWCGNHSGIYSGMKLIVEFTIQPTTDFLGGNSVQTNVGETDGIYPSSAADAEKVKEFTPQTADVQVKAITPTVSNTEIYLGESTDLQDRITLDTTKLNGTNNRYVDVTYEVKDAEGNSVGTYTVKAGQTTGTWAWKNDSTVAPQKDTTYTVTCTSTPSTAGTKTAVSSSSVTFKITVKTCSLTISKAVTGGGDPNQTFVFNVMKGNDLVTTVVLKAGTSKTITGLAVGDYTVVEDTAWSWSYELESGNNQTAALSADTPNKTVTFTNKVNGTNWLTSIADVINKWTSKDGSTIIDNTGHVPAKTN